MSTHLLFVYGTLRKGGNNDIVRLYPTSALLGEASVTGRLFDMGGYPAILLDYGGVPVAGEVYEVDGETLAKLDDFEFDAEYDRTSIELSVNGETKTCWIYGPPANLTADKPEITCCDWIIYSSQITKDET